MSKYLLMVLWIMYLTPSEAQELLLNGGHESYTGKTGNGSYPADTCRRELLTVGATVPAFNLPNPPGIAAVCASPDHLCRDPFQGKAHGGLFCFPKIEIPQYQLCSPTIPGKKYFVSYRVKLEPGSYYAVDQLSTLLGQWGTTCSTASGIVNPKHTTSKGDFVNNQVDYRTVNFDFVADSAYTALMIGNFATKSSPKGSDNTVVNPANPNKLAYYYIDGISVRPDVTIHGDSVACLNGVIKMWLENNISCNKGVTWKEKGNTAPVSFNDTLQITVSESKSFWAIIDGDTLEKSILVKSIGPLNLGPDTSFCDRDTVQLKAEQQIGASYLWQDGTTNSTYIVTKNGLYTVEVTKDGCVQRDTIQIFLGKVALDLGPDTVICGKQTYLINPQLKTNLTYFWQDSSSLPTFLATKSGLYSVTVSSGTCIFFDSLNVEFSAADIDSAFRAPNAFSPNGDQINDQFELIISTKIYQYQLKIFDRYGNIVFTSSDPKVFWDGRFQNEQAPSEVYTWLCTLEVDSCGRRIQTTKKGEVLLLR